MAQRITNLIGPCIGLIAGFIFGPVTYWTFLALVLFIQGNYGPLERRLTATIPDDAYLALFFISPLCSIIAGVQGLFLGEARQHWRRGTFDQVRATCFWNGVGGMALAALLSWHAASGGFWHRQPEPFNPVLVGAVLPCLALSLVALFVPFLYRRNRDPK
jgi:hypothetical protein